jgi:hypothetical protein
MAANGQVHSGYDFTAWYQDLARMEAEGRAMAVGTSGIHLGAAAAAPGTQNLASSLFNNTFGGQARFALHPIAGVDHAMGDPVVGPNRYDVPGPDYGAPGLASLTMFEPIV